MFVLAARFDAHLSECHSLKEKRAVLRPVLDRVRNRHVSISEVDHQDSWQRAAIGVAVVAPSETGATHEMDEVERIVWAQVELNVIDVARRWVEFD